MNSEAKSNSTTDHQSSGVHAAASAEVVGGGVGKKIDTKGRALIVGAWYALYDDGENPGGARLAEWNGSEFWSDEYEFDADLHYDPDLHIPVYGHDHYCLQHCKAATAAGVVP